MTFRKNIKLKILHSKLSNKDNKNILVHLYGAHTIIPSFSVIKSLYGEHVNIYVFITSFSKEGEKTTLNILKNFEEVKKIFRLNFDTVIQLEISTKEENSRIFKQIFNNTNFEAIVFSHDINNNIINVINEIYPGIKNIAFGDGLLGFFFDKKKFIERRDYKLFNPKGFEPINPDIYSNFLAFDMDGNLENDKLKIIPKKFFEEYAKKITPQSLEKFVKKINAKFKEKNKVILLTENISEAGFISYENEIKMYIDIIEKYIRPGSLIIIKNHPHDVHDKISAIEKELKWKYTFIRLPRQLAFYPIEALYQLIEIADSFIANGTPVISIPFFYGKDVISPIINNCNYINYFDNKKEALRSKFETQKCIDGIKNQDLNKFIRISEN